MPDKTLDLLTETTTPSPDALAYILDNPSTTPSDRKVSLRNLIISGGGSSTLTANRTYYVRTDGDDGNNGLTDSAGGAFLTIQRALDVISASVNLGGYDITIQVRDGTYIGRVVCNFPWQGNGTVTIQGNSSTPDNVVIDNSSLGASVGTCFEVSSGARLILKNFKTTTNSTSYNFYAHDHGYISYTNITFGPAYSNLFAIDFGVIKNTGSYRISAGSYVTHFRSAYSGLIYNANTCTLTGTPSFFTFASVSTGGLLVTSGAFSGSATGSRYSVSARGKVISNGGSFSNTETYFPGSTTGILTGDGFMPSRPSAADILGANFSVTSSTTKVTSGLTATVLSGHWYSFIAKLFTTSNVAGGIKMSITSPDTATATTLVAEGIVVSGGTSTQTRVSALASDVVAITAVTAAYVEITGSMLASADGTIAVYFAQNASNGSASSILAGSTFEVREIYV